MHLLKLRWTFVYIALVPLVNWAFSWTPVLSLPDGGKWSPFSIVVGLILIVRDFTQREIGHYVFIPLAIGVAFSFMLAAPEIALASGIAFLVSEIIDWAIYSFTGRPLSQRVLISSAAAVPIDSTIFLVGANMAVPGLFTWWMLASVILSKMAGAVVVYYILHKREAARG